MTFNEWFKDQYPHAEPGSVMHTAAAKAWRAAKAEKSEATILRDQIATQALQGILAGGFADTVPHDALDHSAAYFAYKYADDMLRVRDQPFMATPDLHDVLTHRNEWLEAFDLVAVDSDGHDPVYWAHQKRALLKLLDALHPYAKAQQR